MNIAICYAIVYLIEALIFKQYCSSLFISRYSHFKEWAVVLCGYGILFGISRFEIVALNTFGFLVINFILIWFLFQTSCLSALFHSTVITLIMGFCELIASGITFQPTYNLYDSDSYFENIIVLAVFSKQLFFIILFLISRIFVKSKEKNYLRNKDMVLLITIPLISFWILNTFNSISYFVALSDELNNMVTISSVLLLIATITVWGIYLYSNKKNREFTEMQLQLQKEYDFVEYYKMLLSQHENHNILIHDIKKHLNSIALLNEQREPEKIASYIEELIHSSNLQSSARVCDNEFLNVIVSRYIRRCEELHISFLTDIRSQTVDFMAENDLTSLFCNLLDNAVEAASKQEDSSIKLTLTRKSPVSPVVINMTNSCRKNPFSGKSGRLLSTKPNSARHGFGLKSIQRIVDKYGGNLELYYDEEEKCFHTIIRLKNPLTAK